MGSKRIPHIVKEGSRKHIVWWDSNGSHCSEPNCELNEPLRQEISLWERASNEDLANFEGALGREQGEG